MPKSSILYEFYHTCNALSWSCCPPSWIYGIISEYSHCVTSTENGPLWERREDKISFVLLLMRTWLPWILQCLTGCPPWKAKLCWRSGIIRMHLLFQSLKRQKLSGTCLGRYSAFALCSCETRRKSLQGNWLKTSSPRKVMNSSCYSMVCCSFPDQNLFRWRCSFNIWPTLTTLWYVDFWLHFLIYQTIYVWVQLFGQEYFWMTKIAASFKIPVIQNGHLHHASC